MRKILSILAAGLCAAACIYPFTPDLEDAPEGVLTVDGNISIGDVSTVRLGTLISMRGDYYSDNDMAIRDLRNAKVWVEDDAGGTYPGVPENSFDPMYADFYMAFNPVFSINTENAPADRSYRLCVEALGGFYTSDWGKPSSAPVIRSIDFLCAEEDREVTVAVSVDGGDDGTGYLQLSFDETWEFHAEWPLSYIVDPETLEITPGYIPAYENYWCWASSDNQRIYPVDYSGMDGGLTAWPLWRFARTDSRNHRRYCIRVKAKSLTQESYRFLKALEDNTTGGDNLFTPNPGEIAGNLRCESHPERTVLGYVTFGRVSWKRAFLDNRYQKYRHLNNRDLLFLVEKDYRDFYNRGYLPLVENTNENRDPELEGPYGWGAPRCYDCVAAGGTKTKPDFWDE